MNKNNYGFTLIEVIFSIAFLSIISVIILKLFVVSYDIENKSDLVDIASLQATNEIENIKALTSMEEDMVIEKYYNSDWQMVSDKSDSNYLLLLEISGNDLYDRGLYDIKSSVFNTLNHDEIIQIKTKHYYNYRE